MSRQKNLKNIVNDAYEGEYGYNDYDAEHDLYDYGEGAYGDYGDEQIVAPKKKAKNQKGQLGAYEGELSDEDTT